MARRLYDCVEFHKGVGMSNMEILELFSGTESFSEEARRRGHHCDTVENDDQFNPTYLMSIMDFEPKKDYDMVWASPPCTGFSVASISAHWGGGHRAYIPKSETARIGLMLLQRTIKLIAQIRPKYWVIENPRGVMRKVIDECFEKYGINQYHRTTAWYCKYGDTRAKPTDLWTNIPEYEAKGCKNYRYKDGVVIDKHCHHEQARRGAKTGTQGLKGAKDRSRIPEALCNEILDRLLKRED